MESPMQLLGTTYGIVESAVQPEFLPSTSQQAYEAWATQSQSFALLRTAGFGERLNRPGQVHLPFAGVAITFAVNLCGPSLSEPCLGMDSGNDVYSQLGAFSVLVVGMRL